MISNQAFLSQYRILTPEPMRFCERAFQVEPIMGGESKLMLVMDLPDSGLESYQLDYLEQLKQFADSKESFLTPLELSLEGQQLLAITQLPDTPTLAELGRLSVDEGERILRQLLVKVASAQKEDLRLGCYQPECIHISKQEVYCNILAAVANITIRGTEKDTVQAARSIIQSITGLQITPDSLDSYWQAEINLENPRLRQLLDDLISSRVTWAAAALTQLNSVPRNSVVAIDTSSGNKNHIDSSKTTSPAKSQDSLKKQNFEFPRFSPENVQQEPVSIKPIIYPEALESSDNEYTSQEIRWAWGLFILAMMGFLTFAIVIHKPLNQSSSKSSDKGNQSHKGNLAYHSTCGSSSSSNGFWWPVLGDSQDLSKVRDNYCGDAYINPNGYLQVASFDSESKAQNFVDRLNAASGLDFRVGTAKQISTTPEVQPKPAETSKPVVTCWFHDAQEPSLTGLTCSISSRINANGDKVYDVIKPDGTKFSILLWNNDKTEVFLKGIRYEGNWQNLGSNQIKINLDSLESGDFLFMLP